VAELGGVLDGQIERGMVFTIAAAAGFPAIDSVFNQFVSAPPGYRVDVLQRLRPAGRRHSAELVGAGAIAPRFKLERTNLVRDEAPK
jgi:hypothetical protein